jgi:peptidoglycan/LPS O-acetylase OafA/YrhL
VTDLRTPVLPRQRGDVGPPPRVAQRGFRTDIQGLRAVAVLGVVLYHCKIPFVTGGYTGVDVFLVISGFLITGQLLREAERGGRIRLLEFYEKRARRLLPAAALVVIVTLLVSLVFASPLVTRRLAGDAIWSAFYGLNVRLAAQGVDYLQSSVPPSALQHLWSLAVEEQFYLCWPLLISLCVWAGRRRWKVLLATLLVSGAMCSLVVSQHLLAADAPLAYFSLQSRAWELGLGAAAALVAPHTHRIPRRVAAAVSWCGLGAVLGSMVVFDDATAFPGVNGLLPVLGTVAIVLSDCRPGEGGATAVLRPRAIQGIGRISYAWYLWHWPVLILAPVIAPHYTFGWVRNLEMMILALWLAWLTYHLLEQPAQRSRVRLRKWLPIAAALTLCATGCAVGTQQLASNKLTTAAAIRYSTDGLSDPFAGGPTSGPVAPTVLDAAKDTPAYPAHCIADLTSVAVADDCILLPDGTSTTSATTDRVVLLGDSHAGHWFDAIRSIAADNGWAIEILNKVGCPLPAVSIVNPTLKRTYTECDQWRAEALKRLSSEPRAQLVFVSSLYGYGVSDEAWRAGWATSLASIEGTGAPTVYLADTPYPGNDVPSCVAGSFDNWARCAFPRSKALLADPLVPPSSGGAFAFGVRAVVNINAYLCPAAAGSMTCPAVRGGTLLYRDESHVTRTAMKALAPVIRQQLTDAGLLT